MMKTVRHRVERIKSRLDLLIGMVRGRYFLINLEPNRIEQNMKKTEHMCVPHG